MNTYTVYGLYTISFTMEIEADSREEALDKAYNEVDIDTEWNGNSVFSRYGNCQLEADGEPRQLEIIDGPEDDEDDDWDGES